MKNNTRWAVTASRRPNAKLMTTPADRKPSDRPRHYQHPKNPRDNRLLSSARTMLSTGKAMQVAGENEKHIDLLAISNGQGQAKQWWCKSQNKHTILYSGDENEHMLGVALMIHDEMKRSLGEWTSINSRIISAKLILPSIHKSYNHSNISPKTSQQTKGNIMLWANWGHSRPMLQKWLYHPYGGPQRISWKQQQGHRRNHEQTQCCNSNKDKEHLCDFCIIQL